MTTRSIALLLVLGVPALAHADGPIKQVALRPGVGGVSVALTPTGPQRTRVHVQTSDRGLKAQLRLQRHDPALADGLKHVYLHSDGKRLLIPFDFTGHLGKGEGDHFDAVVPVSADKLRSAQVEIEVIGKAALHYAPRPGENEQR
jgi:hypothetical protein